MKFLDKLGLALFSIVILILTVILCLMGFGWMQPTIFSVLITKVLQSQTNTYILIGVSIFLMLLSIKCLFFSSSNYSNGEDDSNDGILMQNEDGQLLITRETLKNMVESVIKEFANINNSQTNVVITKENDVIIHVTIDVKKDTVLKETTSKLQTRIKKAVKEATDLEIKSVDVKVRHVDTEETEENGKEK